MIELLAALYAIKQFLMLVELNLSHTPVIYLDGAKHVHVAFRFKE